MLHSLAFVRIMSWMALYIYSHKQIEEKHLISVWSVYKNRISTEAKQVNDYQIVVFPEKHSSVNWRNDHDMRFE